MNIEFQFKVGDMVTFRTAMEQTNLSGRSYIAIGDGTPKCSQVVARYYVECSGGVQLMYRLGQRAEDVHEAELMLWSEAIESYRARSNP